MSAEQGKIRPSAQCIIYNANRDILATKGIDKSKNEEFFRLVGGGIEFGETSEQALRREIKEELDSELSDVKLLTVVENIFQVNDLQGHEIVFIYEAELENKALLNKNSIKILDADHEAFWVPKKSILDRSVILYPATEWDKYLT